MCNDPLFHKHPSHFHARLTARTRETNVAGARVTERILTDADCEKIADLLVPKLKASIVGDMHREAGKGLFSLAWKAALLVMLYLAIYNLTGGFSFKGAKAAAISPRGSIGNVHLLPPAKDNPHLVELAKELDRKIGRGG